jgi:L,D-transpeptidase ErfK/SrfK
VNPLITILLAILSSAYASAGTFPVEKRSSIVGRAVKYDVREGESLIEIARRFDLGYNEITDANPGVDPFVPGAGKTIGIPTSWVLPEVKPHYNGMLINLPEKRLYYFFTKGKRRFVTTFPIGIGDEGKETPLGSFRVIEKAKGPSWHVPESIRKEKPWLPKVVKPGSNNPLGSHALRLSPGDILIHGTNRPWGIGREVSHGCIRLYPEDIPELYRSVPKGTRVTIVRNPVKVGVSGRRIFVEVHADGLKDIQHEALRILKGRNLFERIDTKRLNIALRDKKGIPVDVTRDSGG